MPLVRCPKCGRVADGNICFACGHEWADGPDAARLPVVSTAPRTTTRPPAQVTLPQDDFAFEIDLAPDPLTAAATSPAPPSITPAPQARPAATNSGLLADAPQDFAHDTPQAAAHDHGGDLPGLPASDFAEATVLGASMSSEQLALLRGGAFDPPAPAIDDVTVDLSGLPTSEMAEATVVAVGLTAAQLAALRDEISRAATPAPSLSPLPAMNFGLPMASIRTAPPFDQLDPFTLPPEAPAAPPPIAPAPTPPSMPAIAAPPIPAIATPPSMPATAAPPPMPAIAPPPSMPARAFEGDAHRALAMPRVPVPTPPSFAAAFAAATSLDVPRDVLQPPLPHADETSFAGLLEEVARASTPPPAPSMRALVAEPAPTPVPAPPSASTADPPHAPPQLPEDDVEVDVDVDAIESVSAAPEALLPSASPSSAEATPFPPLPQAVELAPAPATFPPLPHAPPPLPDDLGDPAFDVELATVSVQRAEAPFDIDAPRRPFDVAVQSPVETAVPAIPTTDEAFDIDVGTGRFTVPAGAWPGDVGAVPANVMAIVDANATDAARPDHTLPVDLGAILDVEGGGARPLEIESGTGSDETATGAWPPIPTTSEPGSVAGTIPGHPADFSLPPPPIPVAVAHDDNDAFGDVPILAIDDAPAAALASPVPEAATPSVAPPPVDDEEINFGLAADVAAPEPAAIAPAIAGPPPAPDDDEISFAMLDASASEPLAEEFKFALEQEASLAPSAPVPNAPVSNDLPPPQAASAPPAAPSSAPTAAPATTAAPTATPVTTEPTPEQAAAAGPLAERVGALAESLEGAGRFADAVLLYDVQNLLTSLAR